MNSEEIKNLDAYLKKRFNLKNIRVSAQPNNPAGVFIGDESIGKISRVDEDEDLSWHFEMLLKLQGGPTESTLDAGEITELDAYMKKRFNMKDIKVAKLEQLDDSVEVFIGDESIGMIYRIDEDSALNWSFQMPIFEIDLDEVAG